MPLGVERAAGPHQRPPPRIDVGAAGQRVEHDDPAVGVARGWIAEDPVVQPCAGKPVAALQVQGPEIEVLRRGAGNDGSRHAPVAAADRCSAGSSSTSRSRPVVTSYTKPRIRVCGIEQLRGDEELDILPHTRIEILERLEIELAGVPAEVLLHLGAQIAVCEREHPAIGVMDHRDLGGAEQPLRDHQRTKRVACSSAGVPDDVGVTLFQTERLARQDTRVHAGENGDAPLGRQREMAAIEGAGVALVGLNQLVYGGHGVLPSVEEAR